MTSPAELIHFQAHRGSMDEAPENTLPAFEHAWQVPGAIPETDVRTTADGYLICLHDATLARTTNATEPVCDVDVSELTLAQIQEWDAGVKFDPTYAGEKVPTVEQLLQLLMSQPKRRLYLEPKAVELSPLEEMISAFACVQRLLFVHKEQSLLQELQARFPDVPTMTWISGTPAEIQQKFEALSQTDFAGISQLQLHLPVSQTTPSIVYALDLGYLRDVQNRLQASNVELQLCPFQWNAVSLKPLVDLGVRWFVTDAPKRFYDCLYPDSS